MTTTESGRELDATDGSGIAGDGVPEFGKAGSGAVVGVALMEGIGSGVDDVFGSVEIGLTDLHVNDMLPLGFKGAGLGEHFKGSFSP